MRAIIDMTGQRFGKLAVIGRAGSAANGAALWHCVCDCGGAINTQGIAMRAGRTRRHVKHGHAPKGGTSRTYNSWAAMKKRCSDPRNIDWADYGGRGIKVCDRWLAFANFLTDMGDRPAGTSLDRFPDKNGNYEPGNCRWATDVQQANNRRPRRRLLEAC